MKREISKMDVLIDYTNWRGERRKRLIRPLRLSYENNEWHPETQWIIYAVDLATGEQRGFALLRIHAWGSATGPDPIAEAVAAERARALECIQDTIEIVGARPGSSIHSSLTEAASAIRKGEKPSSESRPPIKPERTG